MLNPVHRPEPRKRTKGRARRLENTVIERVRFDVMQRDGYCRLFGEDLFRVFGVCSTDGSEWCHLPEKRRSKTRGMPPDERHETATTISLCRRHHAMLDRRGPRPWMQIEPATSRGADGPLGFQCGATVYVEPENRSKT